MQIKVHKSYRDIVAVCDSNLVGKRFEENNFQLDLKENFYKGEEFETSEAIQILQNFAKEDATFNIVGNESVKTAVDSGIISEDSIGEISGIKFALVLA